MNYLFHLLIYAEVYILVALSLNLLVGYSGLLQVAHAVYYGVGAYTYAIVTSKLGLGFLPSIVLAGILSSTLSLLISLPAWRFRGDAFVMMSLAVQVVLFTLFYNWVEMTGGPFGISQIPPPAFNASPIVSKIDFFILFGGIVLLGGLVLGLLNHSPWGRTLKAMRDDELAAKSLGIPVRIRKVQAFAITCGVVGVAGALFASYITYIDPTLFSLEESILMLSMVIVGGTGNVRGPIIGVLTLILIPELLRLAQFPGAIAGNVRLMAYGLLLIVLMHLRPQGLGGEYRLE